MTTWARVLAAGCALTAVVACGLLPACALAAPQPVFYELPLGVHADSMTAGPGGAMWFAGSHVHAKSRERDPVIGQIDEVGRVTLFDLPQLEYVRQIAAGPGGDLWFCESVENRSGYLIARIGRMSPQGELRQYPLGNHVGDVSSPTTGPDGNLWFTTTYWVHGRRAAAVGRIAPAGGVKRFPLPPRAAPAGSSPAPTATSGSASAAPVPPRSAGSRRRGSRTSRCRISSAARPRSSLAPTAVSGSARNGITYGRGQANKVGRGSRTGAITEFEVEGDFITRALAANPQGGIWFTSSVGRDILGLGSIDSAGRPRMPIGCIKGDPCEFDTDALAVGRTGRSGSRPASTTRTRVAVAPASTKACWRKKKRASSGAWLPSQAA